MFHHNHRIANIAQVVQGFNQAVVITLVQTDGGLIKNIHYPNQAGANLARQADTLRFTTGECVRATIQGEIIESNIHQEI